MTFCTNTQVKRVKFQWYLFWNKKVLKLFTFSFFCHLFVKIDHQCDMIVANAGAHDIRIYLGHGNGTFAEPICYF